MRSHPRRLAARAGLNMLEVVVCTMLVGMLGVSSMNVTGAVFRTWGVTSTVHGRAALAEAMLAEVAQGRYADEGLTILFGPELGEASLVAGTRAGFDDVDDYHGWAEVPPRPKDSTAALPGYAGWSRSVEVVLVDPAQPRTTTLTDLGLKRIKVTVTDPAGRSTTHVGYRSRWGAVQRAYSSNVQVRTYVGSEIKVGSAAPLFSGVNLTNHAQDQ